MLTPCKDCDRRTATCHGSCEDYQAYYNANMERLEERQRQVSKYCDIKDERSKAVRKSMRGRR